MQAAQVGAHAMTDIEKDKVEHIDNIYTNGSDVDYKDGPDDMGLTPAEQKKIIRRVDLRLVVTVGVMYCVSLMDRTNLSAANIAGCVSRIQPMDTALTHVQNEHRVGHGSRIPLRECTIVMRVLSA